MILIKKKQVKISTSKATLSLSIQEVVRVDGVAPSQEETITDFFVLEMGRRVWKTLKHWNYLRDSSSPKEWVSEWVSSRYLRWNCVAFWQLDGMIVDVVIRLEICRYRRSCKWILSCVNYSRKQLVSLKNLCRNMKFAHLIGKFSHTFSPKLFDFSILTKQGPKFIGSNAVLLLAKIAVI